MHVYVCDTVLALSVVGFVSLPSTREEIMCCLQSECVRACVCLSLCLYANGIVQNVIGGFSTKFFRVRDGEYAINF